MMFALFQYGVAHRTGTPHQVVLGLQAFGGAAGNMITEREKREKASVRMSWLTMGKSFSRIRKLQNWG